MSACPAVGDNLRLRFSSQVPWSRFVSAFWIVSEWSSTDRRAGIRRPTQKRKVKLNWRKGAHSRGRETFSPFFSPSHIPFLYRVHRKPKVRDWGSWARSKEGLSVRVWRKRWWDWAMDDGFGRRKNPNYSHHQVTLRVDPRDLDEEIHGLHGKVAQLKQVSRS